jgi:hypothetical protein
VKSVLGLVGALALFFASFALHIVGGATDQGWLLAIAVALILFFAIAYVWVATLLSRTRLRDSHQNFLIAAFAIAMTLTEATLWAASDRSYQLWHILAAPTLIIAATGILARVEITVRLRRAGY